MAEEQKPIPAVLERYRADMTARVGQRHKRRVGVVDDRLIRRYALAIGDMNPIYHDEAAAKAAGFAGLVAPPNLLAGIAEWGTGLPESDLTPDGTVRDHASADLRVMGAGEEMELLRPVVAGTEIYDDEVIATVELKHGRSGPIVFVTTVHEFVGADGTIFNRNRRTVLARV